MNATTNVQGERIRQAREAAGLSQTQLAGKIGAHVTSVSGWERGKSTPSIRYLFAVADATSQPIDYFRASNAA